MKSRDYFGLLGMAGGMLAELTTDDPQPMRGAALGGLVGILFGALIEAGRPPQVTS